MLRTFNASSNLNNATYDILYNITSTLESSDPDFQKLEYVAGTNATGYSSVAAMVFLIYDIMLTFDEEVKYIWPNPWSLPKFIYFFLRYFTVIFHITILFLGTPPFTFTNHECYIWNVYQVLASILLIAAVDYILILRVFALYPRNRAVRYITSALYVAELIVVAVSFGLSVSQLVYDEYCTVIDSPITFTISAAAPIVFQAVMFGLTAWKFIEAVKAGWGDVPLIKILMRDGTWAFLLLLVIFISEALLYGFAPEAYTSILYGWLNSAFAFCGYRILLNLNSTNRTTSHRGTGNPTTGPEIQFTTHIYTGGIDESYPMAVLTRFDSNAGDHDNCEPNQPNVSGPSSTAGSQRHPSSSRGEVPNT